MSLPLIDLRAKITASTDRVLGVMEQDTGRERSEIVRQVLDDWADRRITEAHLIALSLTAHGFNGLERRGPRSLREAT